ncbi:site-specific integrase [Paralimibaculum aggregatum]|uniref:Site-specific integrase n=1 Tax=Paralimibaculum aggregatum TaxID=3036245 RepID=A0ABQ6LNT8_9RHOB|nr:hypothetical protein [Limibaculum sp. NKW23]GMG81925.1 site-specific integrase [Limibaculum sp. NKW23]
MSPNPDPRERWLTRSEAALLLRAAAPHLRRFILLSLYTSTRKSPLLALRWLPSIDAGWIDLERGVLHRRGPGERRTRKRREAVRLPRQVPMQARIWARDGAAHVIHFRGRPVHSIKTGFAAARIAAGLPDVTPHDLKRTAVTWAFQGGMTLPDAADDFSTDSATLERVYRAHSPDHQARAVRVIERGGRDETG